MRAAVLASVLGTSAACAAYALRGTNDSTKPAACRSSDRESFRTPRMALTWFHYNTPRGTCTSAAGKLAPFFKLHCLCAIWRFPSSCFPPRATGMMWSTWNTDPGPITLPHSAHFNCPSASVCRPFNLATKSTGNRPDASPLASRFITTRPRSHSGHRPRGRPPPAFSNTPRGSIRLHALHSSNVPSARLGSLNRGFASLLARCCSLNRSNLTGSAFTRSYFLRRRSDVFTGSASSRAWRASLTLPGLAFCHALTHSICLLRPHSTHHWRGRPPLLTGSGRADWHPKHFMTPHCQKTFWGTRASGGKHFPTSRPIGLAAGRVRRARAGRPATSSTSYLSPARALDRPASYRPP